MFTKFCKDPFQEIKTEYRLLKLLKDLKLYEHPRHIVISKSITEITYHSNRTLGPKSTDLYIMPLKFTFKSIFEIPTLLDATLSCTKEYSESSILCNFASGSIFKRKKQQLQSDLVIPYTLYFDDFQINNALGSHTYSICGCYFNFPTMPQYLLSSRLYFSCSFNIKCRFKKQWHWNSFLSLSWRTQTIRKRCRDCNRR